MDFSTWRLRCVCYCRTRSVVVVPVVIQPVVRNVMGGLLLRMVAEHRIESDHPTDVGATAEGLIDFSVQHVLQLVAWGEHDHG